MDEKSSRARSLRTPMWVLLALAAMVVFSYAVTNFVTMGFRAKRAEAFAVSAQIRQAEIQYFADHGRFLAANRTTEVFGKQTQAFEVSPSSAWEQMGFVPEGDVRCSYAVSITEGGSDFLVVALCDLDEDGEHCVVHSSKEMEPTLVTDSRLY